MFCTTSGRGILCESACWDECTCSVKHYASNIIIYFSLIKETFLNGKWLHSYFHAAMCHLFVHIINTGVLYCINCLIVFYLYQIKHYYNKNGKLEVKNSFIKLRLL